MYELWRTVLSVRYDDRRNGYPAVRLNNLVPEWNDLLYHGNYKKALQTACARPIISRSLPPESARHSVRAACTCGLNGDTGHLQGK